MMSDISLNIFLPSQLQKCRFNLLIVALSWIFSIASAQAKQLSYSKVAVEQGYQFHYQWLDHNDINQTLDFTLTKEGLFDRFRHFKSYQDNYAKKTILRRIKKRMQQSPIAGVQISYQQHGNFSVQARGQDKKKVTDAYKQLKLLEEEVTEKYLKETYYQKFTNHQQVSGIKVDHVSIANDSVNDLKPLKPIILDIVSIKNTREATNFVLSFVQSIPYSTLESRISSAGTGFNPPLKLLWENQGDCDSKMTLTAGLLRALMPRIEMAFIYMEGHAFIGINIPAKPGEITIAYENITYVLAEPTGPALHPLGIIAQASKLAINQGHYSVQKFHEILPTKHSKANLQLN